MDTCPYCNAEIETDAPSCPECGRYLAVRVIKRDEPEQDFSKQFQSTVHLSRFGCGCCGMRLLAGVFLIAGFWRWQFWVLAAVILLVEMVSELRRHK